VIGPAATDEAPGLLSDGAVVRAEAQVRVSERAARYLWASQVVHGRDVLDAGCGAGHGAGLLAAAGARHVIGVDSSAERIGEAEGAIEGPTDFVLGDLAALPFKDGSFEVAVCLDVIEQSAQAQAQAQAQAIVGELRRVLRADGHLLISLAAAAAPDPTYPGAAGRELPTDGLEGLLRSHFATVGLYAQHQCLGSIVRPVDGLGGTPDGQVQTLTRRLAREDQSETRLLAIASVTGPAPVLEPTAVLGSLAGLRGSGSLIDPPRPGNGQRPSPRRGATGGHEAGILEGSELDGRIAALTRRLIDAETENARILELEGYLRACECEVRKFESSMLGRIGKAIFHIRSAIR
jgi:SAM-dependent methyltransferase